MTACAKSQLLILSGLYYSGHAKSPYKTQSITIFPNNQVVDFHALFQSFFHVNQHAGLLHRIQFLQSLPKRHNNKQHKKHNGGVDFRMCLTFEYMLLTCFQLLAIASTQRYIRYTDYMYISENKSKMLLLQIFQDIRCWIIQKNPHSHKPAHLQIEQRNCLFRCIWSFPSLL